MISLSGELLSEYHANSDCALKINEVLPRLAKKDSSIWGPEAGIRGEGALELD